MMTVEPPFDPAAFASLPANRRWMMTAYALKFGGLLLLGGHWAIFGCNGR